MTLVEGINLALRDAPKDSADEAEILRFQKFYNEKKEQGVIVSKGYNLPPLDTVGREIHVFLSARSPFNKK